MKSPDDVTRAIDELTDAVRVGISNYLQSTRGAALMGASTAVARGTSVVRVFLGASADGTVLTDQFFEVTVKYYDLT